MFLVRQEISDVSLVVHGLKSFVKQAEAQIKGVTSGFTPQTVVVLK